MIINCLKYIKRFFLYPLRNLKVFRFSFHKYPPNGYYPCHVKNYDKNQKKLIEQYKNEKQIVVFFNLTIHIVTGGMLSINNFVEHSKQFSTEYNFGLIMSGLPFEYAVIPNKYFEYALEPIDFNYIIKYTKPEKLLLNIPEVFIISFLNALSVKQIEWLKSIKKLNINILNQNDELMPEQKYIEQIREICNNRLTITAAHKSYCTGEKSVQYGTPVFLLRPFAEKYYKTDFKDKKNIILLSPDFNKHKNKIIKKLKKELSEYQFKIIRNMKFEDYKKEISKAKYTLTFGEGFDGYFLEPYLSGSIGFAVYNNVFFPKDFPKIQTLYASWQDLYDNIVEDSRNNDKNPLKYKEISKTIENYFLANDTSMNNLEDLYKRWMGN